MFYRGKQVSEIHHWQLNECMISSEVERNKMEDFCEEVEA